MKERWELRGRQSHLTLQDPQGSDMMTSLPYGLFRESLDCGHSSFYVLKLYPEQPPFCGLCLFREGWEAEVPARFHAYKTIAANGNPETAPKFLAHLVLAMGLKPPREGEDLKQWRKHRTSRAREQYTVRSPLPDHKLVRLSRSEQFSRPSLLFPVASALWKLIGYQPPLGSVLVKAVGGMSEHDIARQMDLSQFNVIIRMAKAVRVGVRFLPDEHNTRQEEASVAV